MLNGTLERRVQLFLRLADVRFLGKVLGVLDELLCLLDLRLQGLGTLKVATQLCLAVPVGLAV